MIGIPCELTKHREHAVRDKHTLRLTYTDAVLHGGGMPVVVPTSGDCAWLEGMFDRLDGVMLPGGEDIPPSRYGQAAHPTVTAMPDAQFETWATLIDLAVQRRKPLLAICAGIQAVNVALGGTLIQDIPSQVGPAVEHRGNNPFDSHHDVVVDPAAALGRILGRATFETNSSHHQALDRVAEGLVVTARSPADGIIEGVELPDHPFFVAVQWHPERHYSASTGGELSDTSHRLFTAFVNACRF